MNTRTLVIYDDEKQYANLLTDFFTSKKDIPFQTVTFTDKSKLIQFLISQEIEILLISESDYSEKIKELPIENIYMLNESGHAGYENVEQVNKYQSSEKVLGQILEFYSKRKELPRKIKNRVSVNMIGVYSPVGRCLQTSFALAMGQILAKKHKVL